MLSGFSAMYFVTFAILHLDFPGGVVELPEVLDADGEDLVPQGPFAGKLVRPLVEDERSEVLPFFGRLLSFVGLDLDDRDVALAGVEPVPQPAPKVLEVSVGFFPYPPPIL
jgi:hypothetical protein